MNISPQVRQIRKISGEKVAPIGREVMDRYSVDGSNLLRSMCKIPVTNTSGIKGVYYDATRNKWVAQKRLFGRHILHRYTTKEAAIAGYDVMQKYCIEEIKKKLKEKGIEVEK